MYKLEYLPIFYRDVVETIIFQKRYLNQKKLAEFILELENKINSLHQMPNRFPFHHDFPKFRYLIVGKYLVFYVVKKKEKIVELRRLIDGRRNLMELL